MFQRLIAWATVAVFSLFAMQGVSSLLAGDRVGATVWWGLLLGPLAVIVALKAQAHWLAILVGVTTVWTGLPVPFVERYSASHFLVVGLLVVLAVNATTGHRNPAVWRGSALALAAVFALIVVRIVVGRPGSARMGSAGGLGEALLFALSGPAFWVAAVCVQSVRDWGSSTRVLTVTALAGWAVETVVFFTAKSPFGPLNAPLYFLFLVPVWLLSSVLLAWRAAWPIGPSASNPGVRESGSRLSEIGVFLLPLALAATSPHRSRPIFALALIFSIAWVFRRFWRTVLLIVPPVTAALLLVTWKGGDVLPQGTKRAISIFVPSSTRELPQGVEVGWQSKFRTTMYRFAWDKIREQPIVGIGFEFKSRDMDAMFAWTGLDPNKAELEGLALAGGYHNAVAELAVACGIPVAILFVAGMLTLVYRYALMLRRRDTSWEKVFGAALLGYWITVTGQMLMNGGGQQFFVVCLLMGAMQGMVLAPREGAVAPSLSAALAGSDNRRKPAGI